MLQKITTKDFGKVYALMEQCFPLDERRTYEEQIELFGNSNYSIYVLWDMGTQEMKAFITLWNFEAFVFIEHFAVNPIYRNEGIGSRVLQEIIKLSPGRICLEVELPEDDFSKRRIGFYERNGFFFNDYSYVQPPISMGRHPIPLRIMTWGERITEEKFEDIKATLYQRVYKVYS